MARYATIAITRGALAAAARLQAALKEEGGEAELWVLPRLVESAPAGARICEHPLSQMVGGWWGRYDGLILFLAVGAVVRLIAPHLQDKHRDPAVVAVDDCSQYAVPVLSGHVGGANRLARRIGEILGARPVITTASDLHGSIAVDLLGQEFGWTIPGWANVTPVSSCVVNGEPVALFQETGEPDWWPGPLPANIILVEQLERCAEFEAALVITDRRDLPEAIRQKAVLYRPRSLVVGVGCNRKTPAEEIGAAVAATLTEAGLAAESVRNWASIDLKSEEPGLLAAAESLGRPIDWFTREQLNSVTVPNPSEAVQRYVGAQGVAEPAALLSAGPGARLILPKQKRGNCTVAVARIHFKRRDEH